MKIAIVTLFPNMFEPILGSSMMWKAQKEDFVEFEVVDLRKYGLGPRSQVDDTPYGGGAGMVLKPEPVYEAVDALKSKMANAKVIMTTPRGVAFNQTSAKKLSKLDNIIILCGHYEGFDERIMELVDAEISVGDYVLTGGELPAMTITDAIVRLIPGVLGGSQSQHDESFSQGLLEYPQYTRPEEYRGIKVPEVLLSGNHSKIHIWRKSEAVKKTRNNRPDLLEF
ncbi:MAG: tRNA (guanosine(37)-N1)-methyltransferase TrmD [Patescibacteria group bacterium]|nr:tRNA (guanosine(37)-N1)-methyltransferase TrmD [Patescibacteria group bacterium]